MATRTILCFLVASLCQRHVMSSLTPQELAQQSMDDFLEKLQDDSIAPTLRDVISGSKLILEDQEAEVRFEKTLDQTLLMMKDEEAMQLAEYVVNSTVRYVKDEKFLPLLKKSLVYQKVVEPPTQQFLDKLAQTLHIILSDPDILYTIRHTALAVKNILTNKKSQVTLANALVALDKLAADRQALGHVQQIVRAVDDILSHGTARDVIRRGVGQLEKMLSKV